MTTLPHMLGQTLCWLIGHRWRRISHRSMLTHKCSRCKILGVETRYVEDDGE